MKPATPPNEAGRLATLLQYDILDTPPEEAFDDVAMLAAHLCQVPTAMVSLVAENRQWFKARVGFPLCETSRDVAFCSHTILLGRDEFLEVPDAVADSRFAARPLMVGDNRIRFYAGTPLIAPNGSALGALCVMDYLPRVLSDQQRFALRALSRGVVAQLEARRHHRKIATSEQETSRLLVAAQQSRRALLGLLEDQKLAETALRASEERFRQLAENIHEVFWMTDPENMAMLYVSPAYEKIWGRTCASLYANPGTWLASIHSDDRERVRKASASKHTTGGYDEIYRILRPDCSIRWIHDRAFPVRSSRGEVYRVVGTAEDITERKHLEAQFLRAQRLEAIGTLSSGIAHDLNNILAPTMMVASLLREKLSDPADLDLLTMVEQGAQRGANIIKQLLTFSRGIGGDRGAVQVRHLLREMLALMRETFPRNIKIIDDTPAELPLVIADATQLSQVLMNLCVNARDAMPTGGMLTLSARSTVLAEEDTASHEHARPGPYVILSVADTGEGVPADLIDRIFEPFFTTKEIGKGTGLGLSTVMGIAKSHGGFVTVDSEEGRGTTFKVYFPTTVAEIDAVKPSGADRPLGRSQLILVVDDEVLIRKTVGQMLERNQYRVVMAADGREGLTTYLQNRDSIRAVLTDLNMPSMSGIAFIRAIRALEPKQRIIAMSGMIDEDQRSEMARLGVGEILLKPCSPVELLQALERQLEPAD